MTAISITLAVLLFVGCIIAGATTCAATRNKQQADRLRRRVGYFEKASDARDGRYLIHTEESGAATVYRRCVVSRGTALLPFVHDTIIKEFTDEDADYNYNCAVELCDALNAKP